MKKIKVILVDDHAVVRAGYKILLRNNENINVVAETSTGEDAIILSDKYQPDVVVMDISLPGMSGIDAISSIVKKNKNVKILVFSMHEAVSYTHLTLPTTPYV